jgi:hypothetical protein
VIMFDSDSMWYGTSIAIAALALQRGVKTKCHVLQDAPDESRRAIALQDVDVARCESEGRRSIWDGCSRAAEYESRKAKLGGGPTRLERPLALENSIAAWAERIRKGFEAPEVGWFHLDDNSGIFLR